MDKTPSIKISFLAFCFIICQTFFLLPVPKIIGYILPSFLLLIYMGASFNLKTQVKTVVFFITLLVYYLFNLIIREDFFVSNYITAIIFNISWLFLFFFKSQEIDNKSYKTLKKFLLYFLAIQVFIGLFQVFMIGSIDGAEGDYVQGSLQWNSFNTRDSGGFNNQIYAIALTNITLFLFKPLYKSYKWLLFLSIAAIVLTGVIHVIVCIIISLATASVFFLPFRAIKRAFISIALLIVSIYIFLPGNFQLFTHYYELSQKKDATPKIAITFETFDYLKNNPKDLFLGMGVGHYSSRASLVNSGTYNDNLSFLNNQSIPFKKVLKPIWDRFRFNEARFGNSTIHRPFYSILSFFTEFGLLVTMYLVFYFFSYLKKLRKGMSGDANIKTRLNTYILLIMIFFNLYLGVFENYYELSQAILPGIIMMIILNNSINKGTIDEPTI